MREATVAILAAAMLVALSMAVILGDRQTVVPAPEAVGEGLIKQLVAHRAAQTRQYLSRDGRRVYPPESLSSWIEEVEHTTGAVSQVNGTSSEIAAESAVGVVEVKGSRRTLRLRLELVREAGLWRVTQLPPAQDYR